MGQMPLPLGGKPGEPVPEVDPDDLKTIWEMSRDLEASHPGQHGAIGIGLIRQACKPGANVEATFYRASLLSLTKHFAPEQWAGLAKDGQIDDAVFRAAAQTPMEWMGVGVVREGLPFDFDEFMRRAREH